MLTLLLQRNFFLLWMAHSVSILGDYIFFMAITFWMYRQTGSALVTGSVLISSTVPAMLFAPLAGRIVDSWDRQAIIFVAESARAVLFLGLLGAFIAQPHILWPIYIVGFLQSALAAFFWPARGALLPEIITPSALLTSNALYTLSDSGARIIAPTLASLALLHLGAPGVITIDAVSFVISAGSVCLLTLPGRKSLKICLKRKTPFSLSREKPSLPASLQANAQRTTSKFHTPFRIGGLFLLGSSAAYIAGTLSILFPIFVQANFAAQPLAYGWMLTAQAAGEGAMSLLLGKTSLPKGRAGTIGILSGYLAGEGFVLVLLTYQHELMPGLCLNLIFGAMTAGATIWLLTGLQQGVSNHFLGHIMAKYAAFQAFAQVSGMCLVSATVAHFGVGELLACDGALLFFSSILAWLLLAKHNA